MKASCISAAAITVVLTASGLVTTSAAPTVTYFPADQVGAAFAEGGVLLNNGTYQVRAGRRDRLG